MAHVQLVDDILHDIRYAFRTLARTPSFTAAVVATVALAVGATTAMFTVVNAVVFRPLPFPDSERTVMLCETNASIGDWCGASPMNVADWARNNRTLESAGVARTEPFIGRDASGSYPVRGGIASPGFFRVLRPRPVHGRLFEDRDMDRGANHIVLVSHAFWQQRLGGDPGIVGQQLVLDGQAFTVVGVLPQGSYIPLSHLADAEVWKPLTASVDNVENRSWRGFTAIGRLAEAATAESLGAELQTLRAQLAAAYPDANKDWGLRTVALRTEVVGDVSVTLWIFLGVVAFVLLIACANVAGLLLVRASGRESEFAVRTSLGAGLRRLLQQLVTESLVLSLVGGGIGLLLAAAVTRAFVSLAPPSIPRLDEVSIDGRVVAFTFALSAAVAVIFGSSPVRVAWKATLSGALQGHRATRGAGTRMRSALVVAELSLALMLLIGAGLLTRSFARLLAWDPGFDRAGLVTTWMLPARETRPGATPVALMERVREEVAALPGVRAAALGSGGPLFGGVETGGLEIAGQPAFAPSDMPTVQWFNVSAGYFDTLGIRLVRGRRFTATDTAEAPPVALVNQAMARRFFGGLDPVGRLVTVSDHPADIIGVVSDVKPLRPDEPTPPQIYWPNDQYRRGAAYLVVRTASGVTGIEKAIRERVASVDPDVQLSAFGTIEDRLSTNLVSPRFSMLLIAFFALIAVLLASVGVYGVIAYSVACRTREIGVRMALGATPRRLVATAINGGLRLVGIGIVAGVAGALAVGRALASLLYGLPANDARTLGSAVALFALVAVVACWLPARRASQVDPVVALRAE
jgi:putative ABC transport system permease protein